MKISVVTAVMNRRATIGESLRSSLQQVHRDVERIVVDGGSTDGTLEVIAAAGEAVTVLVSEPDAGIYDALNKGMRLATGDVVGFLHADDVFNDNQTLSRVAAAMQDPSVVAVYGDLIYVRCDDANSVVRYWRAGIFRPKSLKLGWMPPHPTLYVRRSVAREIGRFDTRLSIAADYDWMLRLLQSGPKLAYISEVQVRMRTGGASNRSIGNIARKSIEDFRALRQNGASFLSGATTLVAKNVRKVPQLVLRA